MKRYVDMRLRSTYEGEKNAIADLEVEHAVDQQWGPLELSVLSPGFDVFVYAMLGCQHTFFRINCAERNLLLVSAEGSIRVTTDEDWHLEDIQVHFSGLLDGGEASREDIDYVVAGMEKCPVSRNLKLSAASHTSISLEPKQSGGQPRRDPAA